MRPEVQVLRKLKAIAPSSFAMWKRIKWDLHVVSKILVKYTNRAFLDIGQLSPFLSSDDREYLYKPITKSV
jgi:hypothetical protein